MLVGIRLFAVFTLDLSLDGSIPGMAQARFPDGGASCNFPLQETLTVDRTTRGGGGVMAAAASTVRRWVALGGPGFARSRVSSHWLRVIRERVETVAVLIVEGWRLSYGGFSLLLSLPLHDGTWISFFCLLWI